MVVSNTSSTNKRAVPEIASRKLFHLKDMSFENKMFSEQLDRLRYAPGLGTRVKACIRHGQPAITFGDLTCLNSGHNSGCSPSCMYNGVIDILVRRNELFTFKEACAILEHCEKSKDWTLIQETIRKYGIVIIGFPECAEEDLLLAVFFFIEDMFGITPNIEFCRRRREGGEPGVVDIIFDNIVTKEKIAEKHRILEGSGIKLETYLDVSWIVDGLYQGDSSESDESLC